MIPDAAARLAREGFAHLDAATVRAALGGALAGWDEFAASWNALGPDRFMADGGRYRRRRHAAFAAGPDGFRRKPHQPHYQSRDYNPLNGGIARWFEPMTDAVAGSPTLGAILGVARATFERATPPALAPRVWHVELHQFRIEASADAPGRPTPEGAHRDGVDWVLVMLVARENVAEGETTILGPDRARLGTFTLSSPLETAMVDDGRCFHGVTPVVPLDPARPGHRDVLVATFRHE